MQFDASVRLSALKKINNRADWETRRGTHEQARDYCKKEETRMAGPWESGNENTQGKRNDIKALYTAVKEKKTNFEILEETEGAAARYEKAINFCRFTLMEKDSDRQLQGVRVIVLYGETDHGKTFDAVNFIAGGVDYYMAECPSHKDSRLWFNGYEGQKTLILDDFSGDFCQFRFLLRLLDIYKLKVEIKGGFAWAVWTTVVITTNNEPSSWYQGVNLAPLKRRIHEIREITARGTYRMIDWDGHYLDEGQQPFPVANVPADVRVQSPDLIPDDA